jgi:hypothetical protein
LVLEIALTLDLAEWERPRPNFVSVRRHDVGSLRKIGARPEGSREIQQRQPLRGKQILGNVEKHD